MATRGWEKATESDVRGKLVGSPATAEGEWIRRRFIEPAIEALTPPKRTKFRAERCIVVARATVFRESEIHELARLRGTLQATIETMTLVALARALDIDGELFASLKEAQRFLRLANLETLGVIHDLERQPAFELHVARPVDGGGYEPVRVGVYRADFRYRDEHGAIVVEDTKSDVTKHETSYRLRKRMAEAEYTITIQES